MIRPNAGQGLFLTLEGVDGAGKSSHLDWLTDRLRSRGLRVVSTREPGGTPLGEDLRQLLLQRPMRLRTETLLMFAARAEHLAQVIEPALRRGDWVVCDRFTDASYAYQGGGRELGEAAIAALEDWVHPHLQPDRTWLFDVPLEVAQARRAGAREADRFEAENAAFFKRTRAAYLARAASSKGRILRVDATGTLDDVRAQLARDLDKLWEHHHV